MDLGRIAVRALFSYLVALALVRLSGKRVVAQATPFDFTIALVLGDLFDDLIWAEVPASQFVVAAGAIFLPAAAVEAASCRSGRFYDLVNGLPAVILREGKSVREEMRSERLSRPESRQRAIRVQKPILHRVLCVVMVEHDRSRDAIRPTLVRTYQLGECVAVPALSGHHELALARPIIWHGESAAHAGAHRKESGGRGHLPDVLPQLRGRRQER